MGNPVNYAALPQDDNLPAGPLESRDGVAVPLLVAIEFSIPEGGVRSGPLSTRTVMAAPEATMDEDGDPVARQDNVGRARFHLWPISWYYYTETN